MPLLLLSILFIMPLRGVVPLPPYRGRGVHTIRRCEMYGHIEMLVLFVVVVMLPILKVLVDALRK